MSLDFLPINHCACGEDQAQALARPPFSSRKTLCRLIASGFFKALWMKKNQSGAILSSSANHDFKNSASRIHFYHYFSIT
jgi:hypothetical protein